MEHETTGAWPGEHMAALPADARSIYHESFLVGMKAGKGEKQAHDAALTALTAAGWQQVPRGWLRSFAALKTRSMVGVEVFSSGTWTDSAGNVRTWSAQDLDHMVASLGKTKAPLKVGHTTDSFNTRVAAALGVPIELVTGEHGKGALGLGEVAKLARKGDKLIAEFTGVPEQIGDLIGSAYCHVSSEIDDTEGGPVLTGVALLGVEEPALKNLQPLAVASVFDAAGQAHQYQRGGAMNDTGMLDKMKSMLGKLKSMVDEMMGSMAHSAPGQEGKDELSKETLKTFAAALGLPETADEAAILGAVNKLREPVGTGDHARTELAALRATMETQAKAIATFERERRIARYQRQAETWTAIEGEPSKLAGTLADVEEKLGEEAAIGIAATYQASHDAAVKLGVIGAIGRSKAAAPAEDAFEKEVKAAAAAKAMTFQKALAERAQADPAGFNAYNERARVARQG